jgi:hypothetical protein
LRRNKDELMRLSRTCCGPTRTTFRGRIWARTSTVWRSY